MSSCRYEKVCHDFVPEKEEVKIAFEKDNNCNSLSHLKIIAVKKKQKRIPLQKQISYIIERHEMKHEIGNKYYDWVNKATKEIAKLIANNYRRRKRL